jgi:hypothetical protein
MFGRDAPTPLPDPVPVARLARTARPRADLQERRDPGAPAGGRGAAPAGPKTASHLAGSGDLRRVDSAPLKAAPMPSPRYRGHPVALASGPPQPPLDQAAPAHPADRRGHRSCGVRSCGWRQTTRPGGIAASTANSHGLATRFDACPALRSPVSRRTDATWRTDWSGAMSPR